MENQQNKLNNIHYLKTETNSKYLYNKNLLKLKEVFPNLVKENVIDLTALKDVFGINVENTTKTSFGLNWFGKENVFNVINENKNYKIDVLKEKSTSLINPNNLYIEAENLDALRVLQKHYFGMVDVIYIDPPYNTGNDFIYSDNFKEDKKKIIDELEIANSDSTIMESKNILADQYHSKWLNMMYPRLYLARNLLREDGVIFISIDDNEYANLKVICDEIFGEKNFVCNFIWEKTYSPKNNSKFVSTNHDYILCFSKNKSTLNFLNKIGRTEENNKAYIYDDNDGLGLYRLSDLTQKGKRGYDIVHNGITYKEPSPRGWVYSKEKMDELIKEGRIWFPNKENGRPRFKRYLSEVDGVVSKTILEHELVGHTDFNQKEFNDLMGLEKNGNQFFDYPKGTKLLKYLIQLHPNHKDALILDFFSGSGTIAQTVLDLNKKDGGNRKFILVQIPEKVDNEYKTICNIALERIKRFSKENDVNSDMRVISINEDDSYSLINKKDDYSIIYDIILSIGESLTIDIKTDNNFYILGKNQYLYINKILSDNDLLSLNLNLNDVNKVFIKDNIFANDNQKLEFVTLLEKNNISIDKMYFC